MFSCFNWLATKASTAYGLAIRISHVRTSAQFTFTFSRGGCAEYGAGPKAGEAIISPSECAKECQDSVKLGKAWYVKEGYDMVTGVGTPAYNKLKELVLKLP